MKVHFSLHRSDVSLQILAEFVLLSIIMSLWKIIRAEKSGGGISLNALPDLENMWLRNYLQQSVSVFNPFSCTDLSNRV